MCLLSHHRARVLLGARVPHDGWPARLVHPWFPSEALRRVARRRHVGIEWQRLNWKHPFLLQLVKSVQVHGRRNETGV